MSHQQKGDLDINRIISLGRADHTGKQQILYDELIKPYMQIISNLAAKLDELQSELTLLKSTKKVKIVKTKKSKK